MERLGPTEDRRESLDGSPGNVQLWLLGGQGDAGGLGVEAQLPGALVLRPVTFAHVPSPYSPGGAKLGDLLEEVDVGVEEER